MSIGIAITAFTIVTFLIGFIGSIYNNRHISNKRLICSEAFFDGTTCGVLGFLFIFFCFAFTDIVVLANAPIEDYVEEKELYTINDTINYVALSSDGNGGLIYSYITEDEKEKHITSIASNNVYVIETTDNPMLKIHKQKYKNAQDARFLEPFSNTSWIDYYEFYVPEGTVTYNYNLDLQ